MKIVIRIVVIIVIVGLVFAGIWYWQKTKNESLQNELTLYGNVDVRQVELAINGSERIALLSVKEGDTVKKGQLLAKLETERLELAVEFAESKIETQRQVVARLVAGSRPEELAKARADVAAAMAIAKDARRTYDRLMNSTIPKRSLNRKSTTH